MFRPRRFYGLDGLLHHPLLPGFPRATLLGLIVPSGSSRFARAPPSPALPSPPGLISSGPASAVALACAEPVDLQGFAHLPRAEARTRIDRRRQRLVSRAPGLAPSWVSLCRDPVATPLLLARRLLAADRHLVPSRVFRILKERRDSVPRSGAALTRKTLSSPTKPCNGGHVRFPARPQNRRRSGCLQSRLL